MKIRLMLLMLVCLTGSKLHAQKVDVDSLLKLALYETNEKSNYPKAMAIAKEALRISPTYTDVKLLVGRLYRLTDRPDSARIMFNEVLLDEPDNADAASCLNSLTIAERQQKIDSLKNRVSITYNPTFFEKEGKESWNLLNVYYGRMTKYGSIIARINYADRSYADGFQFELEAYPKHKNGYSFINFAYSNAAIFQKYRAAYSYLQNFEGGWEGELGVRYQYKFDHLFSYGGSVGKYIGSYWLNFRAYVTPDDRRVSQSYALTGRYYLNTADDYFTAIIGTGVSPDDRTRNFQFSERLKNESFRLSLGYQQLLWKRNVIGILGTYNREEYVADRKENEYDISISFQHRF
jgi:YaiO family outer membrane protein